MYPTSASYFGGRNPTSSTHLHFHAAHVIVDVNSFISDSDSFLFYTVSSMDRNVPSFRDC